MIYQRIRTLALLTIFVFSMIITSFFIVKMAWSNKNLKTLANNYENEIIKVDDNDNNLSPENTFQAIDKKLLNKSIEIKMFVTPLNSWQNPWQLTYQPQYNKIMFEYIFLKSMIKTFPQWKNNDFIFSFDNVKQSVWVKYKTNECDNYLNWFFKIISKI